MLTLDANPDDYPCPDLIREYLRAQYILENAKKSKRQTKLNIKRSKARLRGVKKDIERAKNWLHAYEYALVMAGLDEPVTK